MSDNENEQHEKSEQHESNHDNEEENEAKRNNEENPENNKDDEEKKNNENPSPSEEKIPFFYFEDNEGEIKDDKIIEEDKGKYKYSICILMKNDLAGSSQNLYYTLKGIEQNLKVLKEKLGINSEHIVIFIFVNCLYNEYLFKFDDLNKLREMQSNNINNSTNNNITNNKFDLLMRERIFKEDNELKNIKFYTIGKNFEDILFDVFALKTYYFLLNKLFINNKLMFSSIITAGVYPVQDSFISLIQYSYDNDNKLGVSIAPIEYKPNNLFSKVSLYEKIHFNIFNMNYYFESRVVPVSSLLCTMALDDNLMKFLNNYYDKININASIDFHDYNLGLKLIMADNRKYSIKYNYVKAYGIIDKDMSYLDYQKDFINRYSGYYGNFFEILRAFIDFNTCKPIEKLFLFFQILAIATEFVFPSLACMVIYTVFVEAFRTEDYRIALFFTCFYLCMMLASGICSLITKEPAKMKITNYFLYFFMNIFYLLVIVCSVPAMHFARLSEVDDVNYKFNKYAISFIIVFTFIPYIIPFILNISVIGNNIVNMLLYLLLGASSSTTNFNMAIVWNAPDTAGGIKIEFRKAVHIIIYLLFNLFIGCLSFYNVNRKKRANCVMAFGIMFLVYNFFRTIAIIVKITCDKEESFDNEILLKKIKARLNKGGEDEDEDNNKDENNNDNENQNNNSNENENQNNNTNDDDNGNNENEDNNNSRNNNDDNEENNDENNDEN